jgi:very-short-patch-repair endonuclease
LSEPSRMRPATVPEALRLRPFTTEQAAKYGVTRGMLAGAAWRHLFRGVYVHIDVPDTRQLRAEAAGLLVEPGIFLCCRSAAWVQGVDVHRWHEPVPALDVGCHNGRRVRKRPGWTVHEITVEPDRIIEINGLRLTDPTRTAFDCARWLPLVEAVVVIDDLIHRALTSPGEISSYTGKQRGIRHVRRVPAVLDLCDGRAESPQESRLRLCLMLDGLRPEPQYQVTDGTGFIARIDLAFVAEKVAVEYDGELWHRDRMARDEARRAALERLGWRVIRVYASDLRTEAARRALLARIRRELLAR